MFGDKLQIQEMALPASIPSQDLAAGPVKAQSRYCRQITSSSVSARGLTAKWHFWTLPSELRCADDPKHPVRCGHDHFKAAALLFSEEPLAAWSILKENTTNRNILCILLLLIIVALLKLIPELILPFFFPYIFKL